MVHTQKKLKNEPTPKQGNTHRLDAKKNTADGAAAPLRVRFACNCFGISTPLFWYLANVLENHDRHALNV